MSYFVVNPFTGQLDDIGTSPASTVVGPGLSVIGDIATWNDITGTTLADSGKSFSTDGTLAANSDTLISTQKAVKTYVDAATAGITFESPAYAATTAALTATYANGTAGVGATLTNAGAMAAFSTDSVSPPVNSRILVKNQASTLQNGMYSLTTVGSGAVNWVLTRTTDYDAPSEIVPGTTFIILNGTTLSQSAFVEVSTVTAVGTDPITFTEYIYPPSTFLQVANNLSDLANTTTARSNLGLTAVAIQNVTDKAALVGGPANTIAGIAPGAGGNVLTSDGTDWTSAPPAASGITGTVDQYEVVVGAVGNTVGSVGPGTAGQVLRSAGAASNPAYSTATYPDTVASGSILYATGTNAVGSLAPSTRYGAGVGSDGTNPVYLDKNQYIYLSDEFFGSTIAGELAWGNSQTNGGILFNPNGVVTAANPGIWSVNSGGPTGSFCKLRLGPNSSDAGPIKFGGGAISLEWIIGLSALSDGTDIYNLYVGFGCSVNSAEPTDGAYFWYTHSNNSGNWSFKTAAASVRTTGNSANPATTAFQRLRIDVNADASSISFFFNDVECAGSPLAATIPTLTTNIECMIVKTGAGVTARQVYCDLMTYYQKLTVTR